MLPEQYSHLQIPYSSNHATQFYIISGLLMLADFVRKADDNPLFHTMSSLLIAML